ncbi:hypothetical protein, conserved [Plasmodium vivax]|uniref:Sulfhydryl oxidase n=1 Tax=Plasmodium vivax (strain Salvador I) TaxID=126793 RepID=A5K748_PLAVS|nr:hypothetical protein, conserved [Plasmodium vivax]EDL44607.1 hypothetical protein, conserved [Plasmodium vivax]|eukprot:XP_001614334.1 hypothetical protein [Plasmodium vivax Sal-1]
MGNQVASKVFYKNNDTKKNVAEIKHYEDEDKNKKRENGRFPPGGLSKGEKWQRADAQAEQGLPQTDAQAMQRLPQTDVQTISGEHLKNNEMEKIKQENFYMFDESLNSNDVKHPCHAQWFLFWVFASYLNEKFSDRERAYVHSFYSNFPEQCIKGKGKNCFLEFSKIYPVRAGTREELMTWLQMCENYCRQKADLPHWRFLCDFCETFAKFLCNFCETFAKFLCNFCETFVQFLIHVLCFDAHILLSHFAGTLYHIVCLFFFFFSLLFSYKKLLKRWRYDDDYI